MPTQTQKTQAPKFPAVAGALPRVPKLRFAGFSREWEERRLGDLIENVGGTALEGFVDSKGKYKFISIGNYSIDGKYIDNRQRIELNDKTKTKLLNKGNLTMVLNDKTTVGDLIGSTILINEDNKFIYNQRSERIICKDSFDSRFAWNLLNSRKFRKRIFKISQGGTQIYVNFTSVKKEKINIPKKSEQQKIAAFLTAVDEWIGNLREQKEGLEKYKKGIMQKIFAQEIRFKNADGKDFPEWEEKRLGEVAIFLKGKGISKDDTVQDGKNKCIRYGELYTEYGEIIADIKSRTNFSKEKSLLSRKNDVLIPSSGETALDIATASYLGEDNILLGGDLNVMRLNKNQSGEFFAYYLSNFQKTNIAKLAQGNSVVHLYASSLKIFKVSVPAFLEQQKIAKFLTALDNLIESKQKQITLAEKRKKGLMQGLFV